MYLKKKKKKEIQKPIKTLQNFTDRKSGFKRDIGGCEDDLHDFFDHQSYVDIHPFWKLIHYSSIELGKFCDVIFQY